jgi:hypothetical protein
VSVQYRLDPRPKAACSVSEMACRCDLSRARFYELIKSGVIPPPCYDLRTRRPLYPTEVQDLCLHIRSTNTALDGSYFLFNTRRTTTTVPLSKTLRSKSRDIASSSDSHLRELIDGLRDLGITALDFQIKTAVEECYPYGLGQNAQDIALRTIFRKLRREDAA